MASLVAEKKDADARDVGAKQSFVASPPHDRFCRMIARVVLRPYHAEDEDAAIALWQRTWQQAYPSIDFSARLSWWRPRWRNELVPHAAIVVAEQEGAAIGFVTIDASGYLDQLVVAPDHWGSEVGELLLNEAKRRSPGQITLLVNHDNSRAIRFYERNGFARAGDDVNPTSGRPVLKMQWRALLPPDIER
jgi:putative acetyltransferase